MSKSPTPKAKSTEGQSRKQTAKISRLSLSKSNVNRSTKSSTEISSHNKNKSQTISSMFYRQNSISREEISTCNTALQETKNMECKSDYFLTNSVDNILESPKLPHPSLRRSSRLTLKKSKSLHTTAEKNVGGADCLKMKKTSSAASDFLSDRLKAADLCSGMEANSFDPNNTNFKETKQRKGLSLIKRKSDCSADSSSSEKRYRTDLETNINIEQDCKKDVLLSGSLTECNQNEAKTSALSDELCTTKLHKTLKTISYSTRHVTSTCTTDIDLNENSKNLKNKAVPILVDDIKPEKVAETPQLKRHSATAECQVEYRDCSSLINENSIAPQSDANVDNSQTDTDKDSQSVFRVPYYLENFKVILASVLDDKDYVTLFNEEDMKCIEAFQALSEEAQKLYVRLFSRKLTWHPLAKLKYTEIAEDLGEVLIELVAAELAKSDAELTDLDGTLNLLAAADLKTLAKSFHVNTSGQSKWQLVDALLKKSKQSTIGSMFKGQAGGSSFMMLGRAKKLLGRSYRILDEPRAVFVRVLMLFSVVHISTDDENTGGGQGQLFQMLLVNIGKVVYPKYDINKQTKLFKNRDHFLRFEKAMHYETDMGTCLEKNDWPEAYNVYIQAQNAFRDSQKDKEMNRWDESLPVFLRRFSPGTVYCHVLNQGIEILQRRKDYTNAVALLFELLDQHIFCGDYRGYWWDRLALNLDLYIKDQEKALQAVSDGLADPKVRVGHRLSLYQRAEKICGASNSKYKHRIKDFHHDLIEAPKQYVEGRVLPKSLPGIKHCFISEDSVVSGTSQDVTMIGVEELVLQHYCSHGYPQGLHAEGSVVKTLFCMYFWDIIFLPIPDVFHSPFQTAPLDFQSDFFYLQRKPEIDARLELLKHSSAEGLKNILCELWEHHYGKMCAGLNWERFSSLEHAQGLVTCMGGHILSGLCERFAKDPRHTRSGFPDLTLWNVETKALKISEVKGPGDRLSHKQIMWLDYLVRLGVDAETCHVKAIGAKKLRPTTE